jgi:hypothetical protein
MIRAWILPVFRRRGSWAGAKAFAAENKKNRES